MLEKDKESIAKLKERRGWILITTTAGF